MIEKELKSIGGIFLITEMISFDSLSTYSKLNVLLTIKFFHHLLESRKTTFDPDHQFIIMSINNLDNRSTLKKFLIPICHSNLYCYGTLESKQQDIWARYLVSGDRQKVILALKSWGVQL